MISFRMAKALIDSRMLEEKYELKLPAYPSYEQMVDITELPQKL